MSCGPELPEHKGMGRCWGEESAGSSAGTQLACALSSSLTYPRQQREERGCLLVLLGWEKPTPKEAIELRFCDPGSEQPVHCAALY